MEFNINEIFWTFQGEGNNVGRRALFIRLPDCNLNCSWCDTEWKSFKPYTEGELRKIIKKETSRFVVVTGGEPLMNKQIYPLVRFLKKNNCFVTVETNGTFPYKDGIDWVTCSPKRDAAYKIHRDLKGFVSEYKYVVDEGFDFSILDRHNVGGELYHFNSHLYLSPEWGDRDKNLLRIYDYIKEHPNWRISLQTHKVMGIL